jgi:Xaa-Pro aminopeptidase
MRKDEENQAKEQSMFEPRTYLQRRERLRKQVKSGLILFLGNEESPMNYPSNAYKFRQDSSFLYFFGLDTPGLAAAIDVDEGQDSIYGEDIGLEDVIWTGFIPTLKERAKKAGIKRTAPLAELKDKIRLAVSRKRTLHYLPPYRPEMILKMQSWVGIPADEVQGKVSSELIQAVIAQRSVKTKEEIAEIEKALRISSEMYKAAARMVKPGAYEREILGIKEGIATAMGGSTAFPPIVTINGQIFHSQYFGNKLTKGRLLVIDAGAESALHYASDITRTYPVGGKFTPKQKEIYAVVLKAQESAILAIKPGVPYRDIHLQTARVIASGLKEIGLMKGDVDKAVGQGAHALFFPHGLGHMIGLDVHDMENLGENYVGYNDKFQRSKQFGFAYLRLAKELQPGFVFTVEPGIYFIPALIDQWKKEKKNLDFIDYDRVEKYLDFGGIRIEDDVLVTETGHRVLGKPIPKKIEDVEEAITG